MHLQVFTYFSHHLQCFHSKFIIDEVNMTKLVYNIVCYQCDGGGGVAFLIKCFFVDDFSQIFPCPRHKFCISPYILQRCLFKTVPTSVFYVIINMILISTRWLTTSHSCPDLVQTTGVLQFAQ